MNRPGHSGSFDADGKPPFVCSHQASITIDYDFGIEHCSFCGALGHYNIDTDSVEWTLPEYLKIINQR